MDAVSLMHAVGGYGVNICLVLVGHLDLGTMLQCKRARSFLWVIEYDAERANGVNRNICSGV